ncbi:MAG: hypothetical protein HY558_03945 [Euryarchaeota archaeon]|nr:hypothetical protein [Euryarchaeota archaeon]
MVVSSFPRPLAAGAVTVGAVLFSLLLSGCFNSPVPRPEPLEYLGPSPPRPLLDEALNLTLARGYQLDWVLMASWANQTYRHEGLRRYVEEGYALARKNPGVFDVNMLRFVREDHPLRGVPCTPYPSETDCIISQALHCDRVAPESGILGRIRGNATRSHDAATHALVALVELRNRGCVKPADIVPVLNETTLYLAGWLANSTHPTGPGTYMLMRAGRYDLVEPRWMASVEESLKSRLASPEPIDPHESLLEVLALARWEAHGGRGAAGDRGLSADS